MNLYEINKELQALIMSSVDEDGVIDEDFESDIDELALAKDEKLLNCAKYIKNEVAFISMLKEEEKALSERRKSIEKRVDSIKKYVLSNMEAGEKVKDAQAQIGTRKSEAVEIINETLIPKDLCNHVPESWRVDKTAVKTAIKSGKEIEGAKVVQRLNLTVK
jgi:BioD-like phosphotransacetylase family protein